MKCFSTIVELMHVSEIPYFLVSEFISKRGSMNYLYYTKKYFVFSI